MYLPKDNSEIAKIEVELMEWIEAYDETPRVIFKQLIQKVCDLRIEIHPNDHLPKHFHVISKQRNINYRFDLESLEPLNGYGILMSKDVKSIQDFFEEHENKLNFLKKEYERLAG